jgi:hypothetical protein
MKKINVRKAGPMRLSGPSTPLYAGHNCPI